ncbi:Dot/Icm T4SS effector Ceg17 [Legionella waltersii]|uniref:Uncharacterized protein n=1 Tax=Legionella waltersii TaxID=66969 RepID=A0A0W1A0D6_9GAMM|nr:Dot/Icm T4SS effector Ceg17 [Legionella waltersii]KTD74817.1 hypothetical protein Lwal_2858 [Legionella waltersii]SNV11588.1 Uncharacterised protein [Legionella waltersii]
MYPKTDSSIKGFTLKYTGRKFQQKNDSVHGMEALRKNFSEMGALAIRFQLSLAQFAALLGPVCEEHYEDYSTEFTAEGKNQSDLFGLSKDSSEVARNTIVLEQSSHYIVGIGKILNERSQPLRYPNTSMTRGGESIWDTIHFSVWQTGINLSSQLSKQGFLYLCHPHGIEAEDYKRISEELSRGEFEIIIESDKKLVKTHSGIVIETSAIPSSSKIDLDPEHAQTYQSNGFVVNVNEKPAPMGWILQENNKKLVDPEYAEDIIRVIRISKSGFRRLPEEQGKLLMLGLMKGNEHILHTQNRSFNAMDILLETLEKEYGFDPSKLMDDGVTSRVFEQMQKDAKDKNTVEDLLTINLAMEMIQPLKATLGKSTRHPLLKQLTNPYKVTQNTLKAIIYAFDLKKQEGSPALYLDPETPLSIDEELIDVRINGQLANPDLTNPKNTAALLSIAILVSEQMIVEQLLKDLVLHGIEHPSAQALKSLLNDEELFLALQQQALSLPSNETGPILGLQLPYCEEIVAQLREKLGFNQLVEVVQKLENGESVEMNAHQLDALKKLVSIGDTLQKLETTSGINENSRGINAGLIPVIQKLAPSLYEQLPHETTLDPIGSSKTSGPRVNEAMESDEIDACPFLNGKLGAKTSLQNPHVQEELTPLVKTEQSSGSWCNFFAKAIVSAGVVTAGVIFVLK